MNNVGKRMVILRRNVLNMLGVGYNWLLKVLYFGGIPLSILYGK